MVPKKVTHGEPEHPSGRASRSIACAERVLLERPPAQETVVGFHRWGRDVAELWARAVEPMLSWVARDQGQQGSELRCRPYGSRLPALHIR